MLLFDQNNVIAYLPSPIPFYLETVGFTPTIFNPFHFENNLMSLEDTRVCVYFVLKHYNEMFEA
jgi:hypothetical protein